MKLLPFVRKIRVPIYAQIAAGGPIDDSPIIGWRVIRAPENAKQTDSFFTVVINGDSLIDAAILNGDLAICRHSRQLDRNGQLAAVLVPGGMVLKYVYFGSENRVRLESRNARYRDLWFDADQIVIQAVVVRIERDM